MAYKFVSLIATGSELLSGETVNTNAAKISKTLFENSILTKSHITVSDSMEEIINAIKSASKSSDMIIVTGGLGPTSDDNTREAVAKSLNLELEFSEETWAKITARLEKFNIKIREGHKKQAYFPQGGKILPNENGSAAGWIGANVIFLPGPPKECMPMFNNFVIPHLKQNGFEGNFKVYKWKLIGVVESEVATKLDKMLEGVEVETSYRINYPFVDCKIFHSKKTQVEVDAISKIFQENLVCVNQEKKASELLLEFLAKHKINIKIEDEATKGELAFLLMEHLSENAKFHFKISGLEEFWQKKPFTGLTKIKVNEREISVAYNGNQVKEYAVEYACFVILKTLENGI